MTVKELSERTGISVRTLHYYDEIGLLAPTAKSAAGYRLYDDKALAALQQILFFREFDMPLKNIKQVLANPALEREQILRTQRQMLLAKKLRLERLVAEIERILQGDDRMDFAVFNREEIAEVFDAMLGRMSAKLKTKVAADFGSIENWREHYINTLSDTDVQQRYAKMFEWFGGKEAYMAAMKNPVSPEMAAGYNKRIDLILQKLAGKRTCPLDSWEVREIIGEYGFVMKQLCQVKQEDELMRVMADYYRSVQVRPLVDEKYGAGAAEFFAAAIESFYK